VSSLPEVCVARCSFDERPGKLPFVAEVDGVMGLGRDAYEVLRVKDVLVEVHKVLDPDGVHVVDENTVVNAVPRNAQITSVITNYDLIPNRLPQLRPVEGLIEVTIEPESRGTELTTQR
jgi:hypothetical protein